MRIRCHNSGFSLVEVIAAMLAAGVLVLAAGAMIWHTQSAYRRLNKAVDVQRDMRAGMDVLVRMSRPATGFVFAAGTTFTAMYSNHPSSRVYASGSNLFYLANAAGGGTGQRLVNGSLRQFSVLVQTNRAVITLVLQSPEEKMSNSVVVMRRN
ncbi:MAG: prepilin-type N-terminal cleavage/methylation domain-containing protein [Kiritimatiellae bacterium]|nr:prepilin-type N-terminal cleavage/methylation domain-containing protein [Kiritimatiellia bacterium]